MKNYISVNIIYVRELNRLTQKELGDVFGVSQASIGKYEKNQNYPSIEFIQTFCKEYNIKIDDFFNTDLRKQSRVVTPSPSEELDARIIDQYEKQEKNLKEIINAKNEIILEKDKSIELLKNTINKQEALLNQGQVSLERVKHIEEQLAKIYEPILKHDYLKQLNDFAAEIMTAQKNAEKENTKS